jgi:hypothetical protein
MDIRRLIIVSILPALVVMSTRVPAQSGRAEYTVVGQPENYPTSTAPRRFVVRIRVPYGKTHRDVRALLERIARDQQRALNADALTVFAYRPKDPVDGTYSVGQATIAPYGDWALAGEAGPLRIHVDLQEAYFAGNPNRATGKIKRLISHGALRTVSISRRFESWGDADIIATVPAGTAVEILETRTSGPYLTRYRVRLKMHGKVVVGWIHDSDVQ